MTLPTSFEVTQEVKCQLVELIIWYDSMPEYIGASAGDRFHENIWECKQELFIENIECDEELYLIDIEYNNKTCMLHAVMSTEDSDDEIKIPINCVE